MKQDICIHKRRYTLFCTISITGTEIPNRQTTVARFNNSNREDLKMNAWEEGRGCAAPSSPCQPATELCCGWRYANHEEDSRLSSSQGSFCPPTRTATFHGPKGKVETTAFRKGILQQSEIPLNNTANRWNCKNLNNAFPH
ncbi:hypothetical protein CDAR_418991 [Caerostris darwini]|uniref:Uncharacterized protein n=1 Tax=Caerostris darwini TaxID=1538125 RepID=A0AAV4MV93_9ARAC|nr:hypothetical protein CDAR_418991 [Caerostris darwini]